MGSWARFKNVVLTKKLVVTVILVAVLLIGLAEVTFNVLMNTQRDYAWKGVESLLRNELNVTNSYQISRVLSDMERVRWIECVTLTEKSHTRRVFYDTQSLGSCDIFMPYVENDLLSINGAKWELKFSIPSLRWILFLRFFLPILILLIAYFVFEKIRLSKLTEIQEKKNKELAVERLEDQLRYAKQFEEIAKQVSHDIRSPLSALNMVAGSIREIPEENRVLIRSATQRINDIANDLLHKGSVNKENGTPGYSECLVEVCTARIELIPSLVDTIISEKRVQFREYKNIQIEFEFDYQNSLGSFVIVNANDFKRVLSNLINNSVEAFDYYRGRIIVEVNRLNHNKGNEVIEVLIRDNGKGIPQNIIEKLGQVGVTHGKEGTDSGSGLGIYHAKKTVESFGGQMNIESNEGFGTVVRLSFPVSDGPEWFPLKIDLREKKYLVSLDDDLSIHEVWSKRIREMNIEGIEHIRFNSGEAFLKYVNSNIQILKHTIFLIDFELFNQSKTGLDIIEDLAIEKYAILVTSSYEDPTIQERVSRLKLRMLPKFFAEFIPIDRNI